MDYLKFEEDVSKLKDYSGKNVTEIEKENPELIKSIRMYRDSGLIGKDDVAYILDNNKFPTDSTSLYVKSSDSLKKSWENPVVAPVEKPVEKTAMETLYGAVFPRLSKRTDEGMSPESGFRLPSTDDLKRTGGDIVAGVLDASTFLPRVGVSNIKTPIQTIMDVISTGDLNQLKNAPQTHLDNIGVTTTPSEPGFFRTTGNVVEDIARGPLIPGGLVGSTGKVASGLIGGVLSKVGGKVGGNVLGDLLRYGGEVVPEMTQMAPGALKTALNVADKIGTGAALGTSESVARGEGVDPFGTTLGAGLAGGLPFIGKGFSKIGQTLSDKKTGNILLDAQHEKINGALADLNVAMRNLESVRTKNGTPQKIQQAEAQVTKAQKNYKNISEQSPGKWSGDSKVDVPRKYWEDNPTQLAQNYKQSLDNLASSRGFVGDRPLSLMDALEIYAPQRNPTIPMQEILPVVDNLGRARQLSQQTGQEAASRSAAGKLGALFQLRDLYRGESYLPERIINPVMRQLPDATVVNPLLIRGGNMLKDYLTNFSQQDSTKR